MEGPTPIPALIHAATMVAAGLFFIARIFNLISTLPTAMQAIAWVGGVTALLGATLALYQEDIKKGLAYSTMSQLGYMVLASGTGAYRSALFHLVTHAYSKALSFLGSGSVIHSMEKVVGYSPIKSQNLFLMGGLQKYMPITGITSLSGTLSPCGIPPLARFWSKDEIIAQSWLYSPPLGLLASTTAGLTASYTFRIYLLIFGGNFRANRINDITKSDICLLPANLVNSWGGAEPESSAERVASDFLLTQYVGRDEVVESKSLLDPYSSEGAPNHEQATRAHFDQNLLHPEESDLAMALPLVTLAIPTALVGLIGVNPSQKEISGDLLSEWLTSPTYSAEANEYLSNLTEVLVNSVSSVSLSIVGILISYKIYGQTGDFFKVEVFGKLVVVDRDLLTTFGYFARNWSVNRGYIDYCYNITFVRGLLFISKLISLFDQYIIDGFVNGTGASNLFGSEGIRHGGSGRISHYQFGLVIGIILLPSLAIPPLP